MSSNERERRSLADGTGAMPALSSVQDHVLELTIQDLRGPLLGIMVNVKHALERGELSAEIRDCLHDALSAARDIDQMATRALDLTRSRLRAQEQRRDPFSAAEPNDWPDDGDPTRPLTHP